MPLRQTVAVVLISSIAACSSDASPNPVAPIKSSEGKSDHVESAATTLRIRGTLETSETDIYVPETNSLLVHLTGTGVASQLGRFTMVDDGVASLTTGIGTGNATYTAADGSSITGTASGSGKIDGDVAELADTLTITGGTGRFTGARGVLIVNRRLDFVTLLSFGSIEGAINFTR